MADSQSCAETIFGDCAPSIGQLSTVCLPVASEASDTDCFARFSSVSSSAQSCQWSSFCNRLPLASEGAPCLSKSVSEALYCDQFLAAVFDCFDKDLL